MEVRKEMPEEIRNQKIDGKLRIITEKIPDNLIKDIKEKLKKKSGLLQSFLQMALRIGNAQKEQSITLDKMKNQEQVINSAINHAHRKMKLGKKKEYQWRFDGKENFIGIYNPPKPKKPEKK